MIDKKKKMDIDRNPNFEKLNRDLKKVDEFLKEAETPIDLILNYYLGKIKISK